MVTVTDITGHLSDPELSEKLHELEHRDRVEYFIVDGPDMQRRRLRGRTDKGTDVAVALDRSQHLRDGAVFLLGDGRAIVVRATEQQWIKLLPRDVDAAVALGYFIGNLHWRVRFEPGAILVAVEGTEHDCLARLEPFLSSREAVIAGNG